MSYQNGRPILEQSYLSQFLHLCRHDREELLYIAAEPLRAPRIILSRLIQKMSGRKPVAYIGWCGHRNLGDEVMLNVIRKVFSSRPFEILQPAPGEKLMSMLRLGGRDFFSAILLGGGTLIHPLFLELAQIAHRIGAPMFALGTGVGSPGFGMPAEVSIDGWAEILSKCRLGVRGPLSSEKLRNIGICHAEVIGDPALGMTPDRPPPFYSRRRLIINLAKESGNEVDATDYAVVRQLGCIANGFIREGGEVVGASTLR